MFHSFICHYIAYFSEVDSLKSLNEIIPDLKQILFWMSNALEMLHFLQDNLSTYLPGTFHVNSANDPEEEALANADEELLNVLEEVAMFTFQQTVYHLTKVCCLHTLSHLSSNFGHVIMNFLHVIINFRHVIINFRQVIMNYLHVIMNYLHVIIDFLHVIFNYRHVIINLLHVIINFVPMTLTL